MNLQTISLEISREYVPAAMWVSLLSMWMLVGLFFYLNRYTKREYFTIWTAAWLFYALWLTLNWETSSSMSSPQAATAVSHALAHPEPESLVLMGAGLAFFVVTIRRADRRERP